MTRLTKQASYDVLRENKISSELLLLDHEVLIEQLMRYHHMTSESLDGLHVSKETGIMAYSSFSYIQLRLHTVHCRSADTTNCPSGNAICHMKASRIGAAEKRRKEKLGATVIRLNNNQHWHRN